MGHSDTPRSVIIVGAGIVGVAAGYFLARAGLTVTILDAVAPAAGPTGASDGAVSVASKRPGPMMRLAMAGVATYRRLAAEGVLAGEFAARPTFIVASSAEEEAVLDRHAAALREAGVRVTGLAAGEIRRRVPALGMAAAAAVEVHDEGHAIGYRVVHRLIAAGRLAVRRGARVTAILADAAGRAVGVETAEGRIAGDAVIIAAGDGAARLAGLGPVTRPRKGQLIVTERRRAGFPAMPGSLMSSRYLVSKGVQGGDAPAARSFGLVIDPLSTGQLLIGGSREESGDARATDLAAVRHLLREAAALCPAVAGLRALRVFAGVRTAVADGLPIVGRVPGLDNAFIAAGFEGDGICLGPLIGRTLAALVRGALPETDIGVLDPARFIHAEAAPA
jgi:glycine/D-amino acid oxidase-like deaminating enzyme